MSVTEVLPDAVDEEPFCLFVWLVVATASATGANSQVVGKTSLGLKRLRIAALKSAVKLEMLGTKPVTFPAFLLEYELYCPTICDPRIFAAAWACVLSARSVPEVC